MGHLFGKSCSLGEPYVLGVICLFVTLVITYFSFDGVYCILVRIVPIPGHCLHFTTLYCYLGERLRAVIVAFLGCIIILAIPDKKETQQ